MDIIEENKIEKKEKKKKKENVRPVSTRYASSSM
jgi:hypothetical protein